MEVKWVANVVYINGLNKILWAQTQYNSTALTIFQMLIVHINNSTVKT